MRIPDRLEKPSGNVGETQKPSKGAAELPASFTKAAPSGQKSQVSASNLPPQNTLPQNPLTEKLAGPTVAEPLGGKPILTGEFFKAVADGMGLPKDTLSVALLSFAHFFSLPVNPELVKTLRCEILTSGKGSSPKTKAERAALEAEALARVSAKDKGIVLSHEALERYAGYLSSQGNGDRNRRETPSRDENLTAEELRAIADNQAESDGFLDLLNSLPGKNGRHWLVFPFNIRIKGIEIDVFIRLLKEGSFTSGVSRHIIADIKSPRRQWRCFLKETGGRYRADIRVYPNYQPKTLSLLQKEAIRFLGEHGGIAQNFKGFDEVLVRNGEADSSWVDDLFAESLLSVNKEV